MMSNTFRALICVLFDALAVVIIFTYVKSLSVHFPLFELIFFKNILCFFAVLIYLLIRRHSFFPKNISWRWLIIRSVVGFIGIFFQFYSIKHLSLANATILAKTTPFFITFLGYWLMNEGLSKVQIPALLLSFIGVLFIARPGDNLHFGFSLIALASAVLVAIAYCCVRKLNQIRESMVLMVFYFSFGNVLGSLIFMTSDFVMPTEHDWGLLILMGFTFVFGQFALTGAYKHAPASEVSVYSYITVLASAVIGAVWWHEIPHFTTMIGAGIILFATVVTYRYNCQQ